MKKLLALLLAAVMLISCASCISPFTPDTNGTNEPGTTDNNQNSGTTVVTLTKALDLTAEWDKVTAKGSLVQGCVVVRTEFLKENPAAVEQFLTEYEASINYLSTNLDEAAQMIEENGIFTKAAIAKKAIPNSNVCYIEGAEMKAAMQEYLTVLHGINPTSIGGQLPDDNFYYMPAEDAAAPAKDDSLTVNIYTLNGTTGFAMAKLMNDAKNGTATQSYNVQVMDDASKVTAALNNGDADIAALPTNAAANLYNKSKNAETGESGIKILAVNTGGCLYLLANQNVTINSFADLEGKTVYVPAQNPTFIFTYLCKQNNLINGTNITIDSTSYATPAALRDAVASGVVDIAVLPEPMVTIAISTAAAAAQK